VDGNRIVLSPDGPTRAPTAHAPNRSPRPDLRRSRVAAVRVLRQDYDHISALIEKEPRNDQGSVIVSGQHGTGCLCLRLAVSYKNFYSTAFVSLAEYYSFLNVFSVRLPSVHIKQSIKLHEVLRPSSSRHLLLASNQRPHTFLTNCQCAYWVILTCHKHV